MSCARDVAGSMPGDPADAAAPAAGAAVTVAAQYAAADVIAG